MPEFELKPSALPSSKGPKAAAKNKKTKKTKNGTALGFEAKLWATADLLRSNMDPVEYKHVVLGLLFVKYISDAFEERRERLQALVTDPGSEYYVPESADRPTELDVLLEDRDEYAAENVFWVPKEARWTYLQAQAKQPTIGRTLDDAMDRIELENSKLKGVLPKIYAIPGLDKQNLGKLIDVVTVNEQAEQVCREWGEAA